MKFILTLSLFLVLFSSCERTITFDLDENTPKLVVEATIENGQQPFVVLSRSFKYFSTIDPASISSSFVRNAQVFMSNGIQTHQLKEYEIPLGGYTFYYYSNDLSNPGTSFNGELNTTYSLRIIADGTEYNAVTTIPRITKRIDSLWWKPAPRPEFGWEVVLMARVTDPPGFGDYVRYFTSRNGERFLPGYNSVFDDQVIDGTTYELQVDAGIDRSLSYNDPDNSVFFAKGDTVTVKLCNIDKATYDFWRTMEFSYASIGNPFSSPTKVLGNVEGALGYFGGYAAQFKTLIIPN